MIFCFDQMFFKTLRISFFAGNFQFVPPPSSVGAFFCNPQTNVPYFYIMIYDVMTRALYLGRAHITYWGAQTENIHFAFFCYVTLFVVQ